jgi:hypothetical protein
VTLETKKPALEREFSLRCVRRWNHGALAPTLIDIEFTQNPITQNPIELEETNAEPDNHSGAGRRFGLWPPVAHGALRLGRHADPLPGAAPLPPMAEGRSAHSSTRSSNTWRS